MRVLVSTLIIHHLIPPSLIICAIIIALTKQIRANVFPADICHFAGSRRGVCGCARFCVLPRKQGIGGMTARRIFLDVGGHRGETLEEVLRPAYRFDAVHCFEPQEECCAHIRREFGAHIDSGRLFVHAFGLADFDGEQTLFGEGMGASIFSDKDGVDNSLAARCRFVRAGAFFNEHIRARDVAVMKLNCEGGEVLILRDLINSGGLRLLDNVMIDFDIRKVPSRRHEAKQVIAQMAAAGFKNYTTERRSMVGYTHQDRIRFWLSNLSRSEDFMELTPSQKRMRMLPFWLRHIMQRIRRKMQKRAARRAQC